MVLALSVMAFAVWAAATQTLSITNTVSFVSEHVLATVTGEVTGALAETFTNYNEGTVGEGKTTTTDTRADTNQLGDWNIGTDMQFFDENAPIYITITVINNSAERPLSFELTGYYYDAWNGSNLGDKNITRGVTYAITDGEGEISGVYAGGEAQVQPLEKATIVIRLDITDTGKSVTAFNNSFIMILRNIGANDVYGPGEEPGEEPGSGNFVFVYDEENKSVTIPAGQTLDVESLPEMEDEAEAFYGFYYDYDENQDEYFGKAYLPITAQQETVLYAKFGAVPEYYVFEEMINYQSGKKYYAFYIYEEISVPTIEIPMIYNKLFVKEILGNAFYTVENLEQVIIPETILKIGENAFYEKSIISMVLPEGLIEIEPDAFAYCINLTSVSMPSTLKTIGYRAFENCTSLLTINFSNSLRNIGEDAFLGTAWYQSEIAKIINEESSGIICAGPVAYAYIGNLPTILEFGIEVKAIADGFSSNSYGVYWQEEEYWETLTEVVFSEGLDTIGSLAFDFCIFLEDISFPSTLRKIGEYAFHGTAWYNNALENYWNEETEAGLLCAGPVAYAYIENDMSTVLEFGTEIKAIADLAFSGYFNTIIIPSWMEYIGRGSFSSVSGETLIFNSLTVQFAPFSFDYGAEWHYSGVFYSMWHIYIINGAESMFYGRIEEPDGYLDAIEFNDIELIDEGGWYSKDLYLLSMNFYGDLNWIETDNGWIGQYEDEDLLLEVWDEDYNGVTIYETDGNDGWLPKYREDWGEDSETYHYKWDEDFEKWIYLNSEGWPEELKPTYVWNEDWQEWWPIYPEALVYDEFNNRWIVVDESLQYIWLPISDGWDDRIDSKDDLTLIVYNEVTALENDPLMPEYSYWRSVHLWE